MNARSLLPNESCSISLAYARSQNKSRPLVKRLLKHQVGGSVLRLWTDLQLRQQSDIRTCAVHLCYHHQYIRGEDFLQGFGS